MAKKKSGGEGSGMGLIITLVFFVLTTVLLGVTTYMGFNDLDTKEAAKKEAEKAKGVADNDAKYYRMQNRVLRVWMGKPTAGVEAAEVARDRKAFEDNSFAPARDQKDKDEVATLFRGLNQVMPWEPNRDAPVLNYDGRISKLGEEVDAWKLKTKKAEEATKRAEQEKKEIEEAKGKDSKNFEVALAKIKADADKDRDDYVKARVKDREDIQAENAKSVGSEKKAALEVDKVTALMTQNKKLQADLAATKGTLVKTQNDWDQDKSRLDTYLAKHGPLSENESGREFDDEKARKKIDTWKKDWRVVGMDQSGKMVYINLGSNQGLLPQVTFNIHSVGPSGKLDRIPKGSIEVVRVMGPNQAQARVNSTVDSNKNPIMRGDRLFNATWDPSVQRRVAIAGLANLGGDGSNNEELFRLLKRQNVIVDAYIDTKDDKDPKKVGDISSKTDYLIIADGLEAVEHKQVKNDVYLKEFTKLKLSLDAKAKDAGVPRISLKAYLDLIGYQQPKAAPGASR